MTVGHSPVASLEPLAHCRNIGSLSLFYRYYFGGCSLALAQLVPLFLEISPLVILIECMIFLSLFLDVTRMSLSTVSFLARLDSEIPLSIEFFPLRLYGFKSRVNRHLLIVGSF